MLRPRALALFAILFACRDASDPGFEIVRVPQSAYASPEGGKIDGALATHDDAGPDPLVLCVPRPESDSKEEGDTDEDTDCPKEYQGRHYDEKSTARHRNKGDDATVCCYRKGRAGAPRPVVTIDEVF